MKKKKWTKENKRNIHWAPNMYLSVLRVGGAVGVKQDDLHYLEDT